MGDILMNKGGCPYHEAGPAFNVAGVPLFVFEACGKGRFRG